MTPHHTSHVSIPLAFSPCPALLRLEWGDDDIGVAEANLNALGSDVWISKEFACRAEDGEGRLVDIERTWLALQQTMVWEHWELASVWIALAPLDSTTETGHMRGSSRARVTWDLLIA